MPLGLGKANHIANALYSKAVADHSLRLTIFTALTSLLTGIRVRGDVAMTGEATLRGLVLPVGGIKEKVLAAHRAGIKRIIMPERNKKDIQDVPEQARKDSH